MAEAVAAADATAAPAPPTVAEMRAEAARMHALTRAQARRCGRKKVADRYRSRLVIPALTLTTFV